MHPVGDESGGESLEEPIELESGEELPSHEDVEEDGEFERWLDDIDNEDPSRGEELFMDDGNS